MSTQAKSIRVGNIIEIDKDFFEVIETQHVQPGKGGAYIQITMKSPFSQQKIYKRFKVGDLVEKVDLMEISSIFTHKENKYLIFLTQEGDIYERHEDSIENLLMYKEGMAVKLYTINNKLISTSLPNEIELTVTMASDSPKFKVVQTKEGISVKVPSHVQVGDKIIVNAQGEFKKAVK